MPVKQASVSSIRFEATPYSIGSWTVLRLPENASAKLSSRGMGFAEVTIDDARFAAPLEPDGRGSHWFRIDENSDVAAGDTVEVAIEPLKDWPRPVVPNDLQKALTKDTSAHALWEKITPSAQWEWIRWVRSTNNPDTRARRIEVACSKLDKGMRRPCCFNRNACTEPAVSHNWQLVEPT